MKFLEELAKEKDSRGEKNTIFEIEPRQMKMCLAYQKIVPEHWNEIFQKTNQALTFDEIQIIKQYQEDQKYQPLVEKYIAGTISNHEAYQLAEYCETIGKRSIRKLTKNEYQECVGTIRNILQGIKEEKDPDGALEDAIELLWEKEELTISDCYMIYILEKQANQRAKKHLNQVISESCESTWNKHKEIRYSVLSS